MYCTFEQDEIYFFWCAQCVDLILGFLELVGDSPENENSESFGLRGPGPNLARASFSQGVFDHNWTFVTRGLSPYITHI